MKFQHIVNLAVSLNDKYLEHLISELSSELAFRKKAKREKNQKMMDELYEAQLMEEEVASEGRAAGSRK